MIIAYVINLSSDWSLVVEETTSRCGRSDWQADMVPI